MERIYLDHAATTAMRPEAVEAMLDVLKRAPYNASSQHGEGRAARAVLDEARAAVASALRVTRRGIVFTASGSESDTQAIVATARARRSHGRHIISTAIEHHAVLHALDALKDEGFDITLLGVGAHGLVDPAAFAAALRDDTILASVMLANNELGVIQPVAELAATAKARGALFHTDAVQAPAWLDVHPGELGVDFCSLSGHKFGGPKGVGVLYVREGLSAAPLIYGGNQEYGRRAGTENTAGVAAFARALTLAVEERPENAARIGGLRDRLEGAIAAIPRTRVHGTSALRLPNISCVSFEGIDSEALLMRLDLEGVAASAGSACTSGALEPSHVLAALGLEERWLRGVIRFSLGMRTTDQQIEHVSGLLTRIVEEMRESVGSAA